MLLVAILAIPAFAAAPATAPETFELADGRTVAGTIIAIYDGKLVIRNPQVCQLGGTGNLLPVSVPTASTGRQAASATPSNDSQAARAAGEHAIALNVLARMVRVPFAPSGRLVSGVALANGDVIEGLPARLEKGTLKVDSPRFGAIDLDIKTVRALFFDRPADSLPARLREPAKAEVLLESNGVTSRTPADLQWIDATRVGVSSLLGPLEISKDDIAWVMLAPQSGVEPGSADLTALRVLLTSGEALTCQIVSLDAGRLKVRWVAQPGRELAFDWDLVRSIESPGAHLAYLSKLNGRNVKSESLIGPARPPQPDACAAGSPLQLAGRTFERGVGMRANSRVSYTLGGQWQRLRATVGLDAAARASHGATFGVLLDGKKAFTQTLAPGDEPVQLDLPVSGAKELTLVVEAGPGLDIGDYGDFADARIIR